MRFICSICLLLIFGLSSHSQTKNVEVDNKNDSVKQRLIGKTPGWILGDDDSVCDIRYSYLGKIITKDKKTYLIATLSLDAGHSCKNTTRILIYDSLQNYFGNYYTEGALPNAVNQNKLCGQDFIPVDLSIGIPDSIQ